MANDGNEAHVLKVTSFASDFYYIRSLTQLLTIPLVDNICF